MLIEILKWTFAIIGHLGLWCVFYNHIHATAWPRDRRKRSEKIIAGLVFVPMIWVLVMMIRGSSISFEQFREIFLPAHWYGIICILLGCFFTLRWCVRKATTSTPAAIVSRAVEKVKIGKELDGPLLHGRIGRLFAMIPGNQATQLSIEHITFGLANCPEAIDGLRICQISDLHFLGQLDRRYFERVVHYANAFQPDLIAITGDIVESVECLDWIDSVLGELTAPAGIYYVLGNHDRRIKDEDLLRVRLKSANIIRAGGCWVPVKIQGTTIFLAGNELPWYSGAENLTLHPPDVEEACNDAIAEGSAQNSQKAFRILLTHSPDQIDWARPYEFDLILAGHTHGGQIRLPVIGPVIAPSKYGVKYCGGTYEFGPTTMHVSRGISGDDSIRLNCPPELGCFTLRAVK